MGVANVVTNPFSLVALVFLSLLVRHCAFQISAGICQITADGMAIRLPEAQRRTFRAECFTRLMDDLYTERYTRANTGWRLILCTLQHASTELGGWRDARASLPPLQEARSSRLRVAVHKLNDRVRQNGRAKVNWTAIYLPLVAFGYVLAAFGSLSLIPLIPAAYLPIVFNAVSLLVADHLSSRLDVLGSIRRMRRLRLGRVAQG